jgi:hypothetical protein
LGGGHIDAQKRRCENRQFSSKQAAPPK